MGICLDTESKRFVIMDNSALAAAYSSWPRPISGVRQQRPLQERASSEPILALTDKVKGLSTRSSGPGPPKQQVAINVQQRTQMDKNLHKISKIPVIFVLGGPGSGKLTHCHCLSQNDNRVIHINMLITLMDLAASLGSRDPNMIPAYKALEILIDKMLAVSNPVISCYIITGYPRNMRDVVEYMAKVKRIDAVILLDWSDRSLERQIKLGARSGQIDLNLARIEIQNYRSNVIPVAQFFDQQGYLHLVAGERAPSEIFSDLSEEINGFLLHPLSSADPRFPRNRPRSDTSTTSQQVKAVVHNPSAQRRDSIDSVDLMIEQELLGEPTVNRQNVTSSAVSEGTLHRDVENILQLVQAGSILERSASVRRTK